MREYEIIYTRELAHLLTSSPQKNRYYTILLCLAGSLVLKVGYHSFTLESGMISIIPADTMYTTEEPSPDLTVLQLSFSKSFLQKMFFKDDIVDELLDLNVNYPPVFTLLDDDFGFLQTRFEHIGRELERKAAYHLDIVRLVLTEILYGYNRACEYCLLGFQKNMNRNYQLTYQFRRLVDTHFLEWRTLTSYAEQLGITAKHLTEVVKEETGQTALQVLHERLLRESQYLLKHSNHSVKECGYLLGFDDPSYFNRFFKSHLGISPNNYREDH